VPEATACGPSGPLASLPNGLSHLLVSAAEVLTERDRSRHRRADPHLAGKPGRELAHLAHEGEIGPVEVQVGVRNLGQHALACSRKALIVTAYHDDGHSGGGESARDPSPMPLDAPVTMARGCVLIQFLLRAAGASQGLSRSRIRLFPPAGRLALARLPACAGRVTGR
jgi:hypothetical protein